MFARGSKRARTQNKTRSPSLAGEADDSSLPLEAAKELRGSSPAHFQGLRSTRFSTAGLAQRGWEQLENPQGFRSQMLSNILMPACFVLSQARARGGELCCFANVTIMIKVEASKAELTLLEGARATFCPTSPFYNISGCC